jgi:hypothetical protein
MLGQVIYTVRNQVVIVKQIILKQGTRGAGQETYRTILESTLSEHASGLAQTSGLLLSAFQRDTIALDTTELFALFDKRASLNADLQRLDYYMQEELYDRAQEWTTHILWSNTGMTKEQNFELNKRLELVALEIEVLTQGNRLDQLSEVQLESLTAIAESSEQISGIKARNWLNHLYDGQYETYPLLPTEQNKSLKDNDQNSVSLLEGKLEVYPNPSKDWAVFSYELPVGAERAELVIIDARGAIVCQQQLENSFGQFIWDTRELASGYYIYSMFVDGTMKQGGKIIVMP